MKASREGNQNLWNKVNELKEKLMSVEMSISNLDQNNQQNNIEIQDIPASVSDDRLEDKVIDIFKLTDIRVDKK